MGLVKCPDCGKDVSDAAQNCIGCGRPMGNQASRLPVKETLGEEASSSGLIGAFIAVVGFILGGIAVFINSFILGVVGIVIIIVGARFGAKYK